MNLPNAVWFVVGTCAGTIIGYVLRGLWVEYVSKAKPELLEFVRSAMVETDAFLQSIEGTPSYRATWPRPNLVKAIKEVERWQAESASAA